MNISKFIDRLMAYVSNAKAGQSMPLAKEARSEFVYKQKCPGYHYFSMIFLDSAYFILSHLPLFFNNTFTK